MAQSTSNYPLLIIIVNYRAADLVVNCLHSLVNEVKSLPGTRVAIVDNPSGDNSVEKISAAIARENWSDWVSLVQSDYNGGYSFGNNFAIRPALASDQPPNYFWLLNPDTTVYPGALKALVDFMDQHPQVGIAGSSFEEANGDPWHVSFRFPTVLSELDSALRLGVVSKLLSKWVLVRQMGSEPDQVDWLPGASLLIRRQVFDTIGLMDEDYFLYYEETDFCLQARRSGWECWYVPQSRVMHIAGQSTGVTVRTDAPKRLPTYWFDSRRRYFVKNHGFFYAALTDAVWLTGFVLWRIRRLIQRKPDLDPPKLLEDFVRNSVILKGANLANSNSLH